MILIWLVIIFIVGFVLGLVCGVAWITDEDSIDDYKHCYNREEKS